MMRRMMRRAPRGDNQGFLLIGSLLLMTLVLTYSSLMTTRTMTQQLGVSRLNNQFQAIHLAQGAIHALEGLRVHPVPGRLAVPPHHHVSRGVHADKDGGRAAEATVVEHHRYGGDFRLAYEQVFVGEYVVVVGG